MANLSAADQITSYIGTFRMARQNRRATAQVDRRHFTEPG